MEGLKSPKVWMGTTLGFNFEKKKRKKVTDEQTNKVATSLLELLITAKNKGTDRQTDGQTDERTK